MRAASPRVAPDEKQVQKVAKQLAGLFQLHHDELQQQLDLCFSRMSTTIAGALLEAGGDIPMVSQSAAFIASGTKDWGCFQKSPRPSCLSEKVFLTSSMRELVCNRLEDEQPTWRHDAPEPTVETWEKVKLDDSSSKGGGMNCVTTKEGPDAERAPDTRCSTSGQPWKVRRLSNSKAALQRRALALASESRAWLLKMLKTRVYETMILLVVVLNGAFIGWQVQNFANKSASDAERDTAHEKTYRTDVDDFMEVVFLILFVTDIVLRFLAEGFAFFHRSEDWNWNTFDFVVVVAMGLEFVLGAVASNDVVKLLKNVPMLKILRIIRLARILKIIRVLSYFKELRLMLSSIINSFRSLIWAILVMAFMFYIFGIGITQGAVEYLNSTGSWPNASEQLLAFTSLDNCILELLEAMTGGVSWGEHRTALKPLPIMYGYIYLGYIAVSIFVVMNVVTGVFVETAMARSVQDRETIIQDAMANKEEYLEHVRTVFGEIDTDDTGTISFDEFKAAIEDRRLRMYLETLGLDMEEVETLFMLLDRDQAGSIDIDEFLSGCLKLKGEAKGVGLALLQFESKWLMFNMTNVLASLSGLHTEMLQLRENILIHRRRRHDASAARTTMLEEVEGAAETASATVLESEGAEESDLEPTNSDSLVRVTI